MTQKRAAIGLMNPKSPTNVGSVLRAAGCMNAQQIFYSGERYDRAKAFYTDTQNSNKAVTLTHVDELFSHAPIGAKIVGVELVEGAQSLIEFQHPDNAYYIFGPEDGSLTQKQVNQCHAVVYIPTKGCLNLAATVNVVLYDRLSKSADIVTGDELIRKSRDTNNTAQVK